MLSNLERSVAMNFAKETKRKVVYASDENDFAAPVETVYVEKRDLPRSADGEWPKAISLTINLGE